MKSKLWFLQTAFALLASMAWGQGTFVYDQQSSTDESPPTYGEGITIQSYVAPYGQSFTPSLDAVGFIRLKLNDPLAGFGGATVWVNLISGSISGPVIGTTDQVVLTGGWAGTFDFIFPTPVSVTPGVQYFFTPVIQPFFSTGVNTSLGFYSGGSIYERGVPVPDGDWWFREGVIVPEPSSVILLLLGGSAFALFRRGKTNPTTKTLLAPATSNQKS